MWEDICYLFYMTQEVWYFAGILMVFMIGEEVVEFYKRKNG